MFLRSALTLALLPLTLAAAPRLNVVFLLADDLRADTLGCAGDRNIRTPNLDALAERGTRFRNGFVTTSICACSRASILTGQYMRRTGVNDFAKSLTPEQWSETYPALLREAGYHTGFIGKFGVGNVMPTKAFDVWHGFPGQGNYFAKGDTQHLTAKMGDQALAFLADRPADKPFCLSVSFKAPHTQNETPGQEYPIDPRDAELYADADLPNVSTFGDRFFQLLPSILHRSEGRLRFEKRKLAEPERMQANLRNYYRLVTGVDREVGRLVAALREPKLDGQTLIVFSSDNGYFLGGRGLVDKFFAYEESIRVPMIVFDPRGKAQVRDEMALNIDIAPTLLGAAGVSVPERMQGRDLAPLLRGESPKWRDDFFYEQHFEYGGAIPRCEAVRESRWKFVRYPKADPVVEQLFDLANDKLEERDLAGDAAHLETLLRLRKRWEQLSADLR